MSLMGSRKKKVDNPEVEDVKSEIKSIVKDIREKVDSLDPLIDRLDWDEEETNAQ